MAYWVQYDNVVFKRCNIHAVTCLAHALQSLAKKIRGEYSDVDKVVSSVKRVFQKAPIRNTYTII